MGRRSFGSVINAIAREAARQQRLVEAEQRRAVRDAQRTVAAQQRMEKEAAREAKIQYLLEREDETAILNEEVLERLEELRNILHETLDVDDTVHFDSLRILNSPPALRLPEELATAKAEPKEFQHVSKIKAPSGVAKLIPGSKQSYERRLALAIDEFQSAHKTWRTQEAQRLQNIAELKDTHAREIAAFESKKRSRNAEVDDFEKLYHEGDPDSIIAYCGMVLERSSYPDGFPQNFSLGYTQSSKMLVVEYELPLPSIIPAETDFKYTKTRDTIGGKPVKAAEVRSIYTDIIASVALRTIHEIFEADHDKNITTCCFNGYINTIDAATGRDIVPHLVSVRATEEEFAKLDLRRVEKVVCLRNLGAQVSRGPTEAQAVKPIVDFNMVDPRFVDQRDMIGDLSAAQNLMDLNPWEFEQLVANLFSKHGLETKLTRSSRDGGVDCVAFDPRPVLGGKVIIQAKRYKSTVGVSAVRDLYGTMMNEGASKGLLVTTSGYGTDAYAFAKDKPIELLDGGALLFLLKDVGIEARIIMPDE